MFKKVACGLGLFLLVTPLAASAAPVDELYLESQLHVSEILALQVRLNALLTQLAILQGQQTNQVPLHPTTCPKLTVSFSFGAYGNDVLELQRYLVTNGYLTADSVTGFFGDTTDAAVRRFQLDRGIVHGGTTRTTGIGIVGPATRLAIATSCSYGTDGNYATSTIAASTSPSTTNTDLVSQLTIISQQLQILREQVLNLQAQH
ncbi:peptidoglycan-binding protein [Candidatus Kaiserbacteria bacterium]|nr:peptidoglycan-binding protein [Candidatus Kaiserbacteria bacterium]